MRIDHKKKASYVYNEWLHLFGGFMHPGNFFCFAIYNGSVLCLHSCCCWTASGFTFAKKTRAIGFIQPVLSCVHTKDESCISAFQFQWLVNVQTHSFGHHAAIWAMWRSEFKFLTEFCTIFILFVLFMCFWHLLLLTNQQHSMMWSLHFFFGVSICRS